MAIGGSISYENNFRLKHLSTNFYLAIIRDS